MNFGKVSKTTWIILFVGVFVISVISLGMVYTQQKSQEDNLKARLAAAKQKLALIKTDDLQAEKVQLTGQLADYTSKLEFTGLETAPNESSISATDRIIQIAKDSNVDIESIASEGESQADLASIDCNTLPLAIKIVGKTSDVNEFMRNMNIFVRNLTAQFPTGKVEAVLFEAPTPTPTITPTPSPTVTPTTTPGSGDKAYAVINMTIYYYEGK